MKKERIDLHEKIESYKYQLGLLQKIPCSKEDNKIYKEMIKSGKALPEGVFAYTDNEGKEYTDLFYTIYETELDKEEITEYLTLKKISLLTTIKNCAVFFVVLTIISLLITAIVSFGNMR